MKKNQIPNIVDYSVWESELSNLLIKEKEVTRLSGEVAAQRRRLPMHKISKDYNFETEEGTKSFLDLFEGRRQLIVYHFMFDPEWEQGCPGCSWVVDAMSNPNHLNACGVSIIIIGLAPLKKLLKYKNRMGWWHRWASSKGSDFNPDFGATKNGRENHGVSVFFREGNDIYQTYHSEDRGVEHLGSHWTYLDLTPYGRKEEWEDSPAGYPQNKVNTTTCRHDSYEVDGREF